MHAESARRAPAAERERNNPSTHATFYKMAPNMTHYATLYKLNYILDELQTLGHWPQDAARRIEIDARVVQCNAGTVIFEM